MNKSFEEIKKGIEDGTIMGSIEKRSLEMEVVIYRETEGQDKPYRVWLVLPDEPEILFDTRDTIFEDAEDILDALKIPKDEPVWTSDHIDPYPTKQEFLSYMANMAKQKQSEV